VGMTARHTSLPHMCPSPTAKAAPAVPPLPAQFLNTLLQSTESFPPLPNIQ
jgi:hypothetical protein